MQSFALRPKTQRFSLILPLRHGRPPKFLRFFLRPSSSPFPPCRPKLRVFALLPFLPLLHRVRILFSLHGVIRDASSLLPCTNFATFPLPIYKGMAHNTLTHNILHNVMHSSFRRVVVTFCALSSPFLALLLFFPLLPSRYLYTCDTRASCVLLALLVCLCVPFLLFME